ncbi:MAG: hypothetical protein U9R44_05985 [Candidatus Omnitrophota bacterium]|nr:hypothetical protein [Candidatus Omnitrophota bacterium]
MIAVDVVLLPPADVIEKAVRMNQELVETGNNDIVLDMEKCLPHVTLAMGCVKEGEIGNIDGILKGIAASFSPVEFKVVPSAGGGKAWFRIEKNRDIELLHEIIMIRLSPFFNYKITEGMICRERGEEVNGLTLDYIRKFPVDSSFENYTPHITVGTGVMGKEVEYFKFVSEKLALCHLGDYCTCRKVLLSHRLSLER